MIGARLCADGNVLPFAATATIIGLQHIYEMSLLAVIVRNEYRCLPHREFTEHVGCERMRPVAALYAYKVLTFVIGRRIRFGNNDDK